MAETIDRKCNLLNTMNIVYNIFVLQKYIVSRHYRIIRSEWTHLQHDAIVQVYHKRVCIHAHILFLVT